MSFSCAFYLKKLCAKYFIQNSLLIGSTIVLYNVEGHAAQLEAFIRNFLLLSCCFLQSKESMGPSVFDKI